MFSKEGLSIPYSRKYWRSIKFGGWPGKRPSNLNPSNFKCDLRVNHAPTIRDLHSCARARTYVLFYACGICMEVPPNLNLPICLFRRLGTKPPNLKIANISGYTIIAESFTPNFNTNTLWTLCV